MVAGANEASFGRTDRFEAWLAAERGRFALWLPMFMGAGVLLYFALRAEPPAWVGAAAALPALAGAMLVRRLFFARAWLVVRAALLALAAAGIGLAAAQWETASVAPHDLLPPRAVVLHGTVRGVEAVANGRRITLDAVRIEGSDHDLHRRLRVRLKAGDTTQVTSGDIVSVRALVQPATPPAYPGAWDLQRDSFFAGLAGAGRALGTVMVRDRAATTPMHWMLRLRETINQRIDAVLSGAVGALAQALLSGVMTGVPPPDMAAFRDSGLAHLLSVSGLHIAIVMGIGVVIVRAALAAWPYAALRWPCKGIALVTGLATGAFYMVLTGSQVPMVRSFAMAAFVALAMLLGRRAFSMRSLAIAAAMLVLVEPDALTGASLQMSFAAVMALLAGHEALGPALRRLHRDHGWWGKAAAYLLGLLMTSLLAGTATLPFGAYHFGQVQFYFALSNLAAVPLTGVLVMPAGMLSLGLMPLGWERPALVVMGWGLDGVLWIAHATAALPGATWRAPHMPPWGLAAVALGMAWLSLWRSRLRLAGLAAILLGLASPALVHPPDMLVSAEARLIGIRTPAGVFVQQGSGASKFTRDAWLRYWSESGFQVVPAQGVTADGAIACTREGCRVRPVAEGRMALLVRGAARPATCADVAVLVSAEPARGLCVKPWPPLVDRFTVWRYGATAIWLDGAHATILTDRSYRGDRPWVPPLPTPRANPVPALPPARTDPAPETPATDTAAPITAVRATPDRVAPGPMMPARAASARITPDRIAPDRIAADRIAPDRIAPDRIEEEPPAEPADQ